ncbi:hypothetical protein Leryth_005784 [Lithospermum erythrorhizon]|nr:hypothetical protein Leryth_005784 [Lithospermum erythrorhizon]
MARVSNVIITILNVVFLILSVVAIGFSIWLYINSHGDNLCNRTLHKPLLFVGLALFAMSLIGFVGSFCKSSFFLWIYLALNFFLIVGLIGFTMFTIVVTNEGVGNALSKKGFKSARLGDYSNWLQNHVVNGENWDNIKSCFVKMEFCHKFQSGKGADFYKTKLSPTQSGCCKPPTYCGLEFHNGTFWSMPKKGPLVPDSDCQTWSNVQTELCFECKSCKASVLYNIKDEWRTVALANFIITIIIIIVYSIGCCALKGNRGGSYKSYHH